MPAWKAKTSILMATQNAKPLIRPANVIWAIPNGRISVSLMLRKKRTRCDYFVHFNSLPQLMRYIAHQLALNFREFRTKRITRPRKLYLARGLYRSARLIVMT